MSVDHSQSVITPDGTRIHVVDRGKGDTVLFIPGLGYGTWSWHYQLGPISEFARVLLIDNRGVGLSDRPPGPYTIPMMAEDAYEVVRQRANGPVHVVGASMGGYIAMSLALQHPESVKSLTLLATTSGGRGSRRVPEETLAAWARAVPLGSAGFARATMPLSFAPGWLAEHEEEFERLLQMRLAASTPIDSWRAQFEACASYFNTGLPPGPIHQPTVIVHGTADRVVPYENAAHLSQRIPHAPVITLEGTGHLCWIEQATAVNEIIGGVLGRRSIREGAREFRHAQIPLANDDSHGPA
jgi:3-oxoadipate enol-lactonase